MANTVANDHSFWPDDAPFAEADAFAKLPRLCPWLHLPAQSGSSEVLRRMARDSAEAELAPAVKAVVDPVSS